MKTSLRLCAAIMVCVQPCSTKAEDIELSRMTTRDSTGSNTVSWTVSSEAFEKQPSWDPLSREIPLPPQAAVRKAAAWLQTQGETTNDLRVTSIDLKPSQDGKWLYWIRFAARSPGHNSVLVMLDGTIVEPIPASTNAPPVRLPFLREARTPTNLTNPTVVGMKGSYETVEAKIIKAFVVDDEGARFRAYQVKWKDHEIIVEDPLSRSDKREGDTLVFMVSRSELPHGGEEKVKLLHFTTMDFSGRNVIAPKRLDQDTEPEPGR